MMMIIIINIKIRIIIVRQGFYTERWQSRKLSALYAIFARAVLQRALVA